MKTGRPTLWRSPSARLRASQERRARDAAALRKLAEACDAREAIRQPAGGEVE